MYHIAMFWLFSIITVINKMLTYLNVIILKTIQVQLNKSKYIYIKQYLHKYIQLT